MESTYINLYTNIINPKININKNKNILNLKKKQLKKNQSLPYYNFDGRIHNDNKLNLNELKINISKKYKITNNENNKKDNNKDNSSYSIYLNKESNDILLLTAYKKSVSELFKLLKLYLNKELYKYNNIKKEFSKNLEKFYNQEKIKEKKNKRNKTPLNLNNNGYSTMNKLKKDYNIYAKIVQDYKINNSNKLEQVKNKHNIMEQSMNKSNYNVGCYKNQRSFYSIMNNKKNNLKNSPIKKKGKRNIMKKFIKNISDNKTMKINKQINTENIIENKVNYPNNNNEILSKIKDSVDENLKHIFNFSYENFLNKESERDIY